MVSNLTITVLAVAALLGLLLPLSLMAYFKKKYNASYKAFLLGALTFIVFVIILEQNAHKLILTGPLGEIIAANSFLYAFYGGLMAGLFEELGRYLIMRFFMAKELDNEANALMFGVGHGGVEVIFILVLSFINYIIYAVMINNGSINELMAALSSDAQAQLQIITYNLLYSSPFSYLLGLFERISAIIAHIAMSYMVFKAVKDHKPAYLGLAILAHALLDGLSVIISAYLANFWLVELLIFIMVLMIVFVSKKLANK